MTTQSTYYSGATLLVDRLTLNGENLLSMRSGNCLNRLMLMGLQSKEQFWEGTFHCLTGSIFPFKYSAQATRYSFVGLFLFFKNLAHHLDFKLTVLPGGFVNPGWVSNWCVHNPSYRGSLNGFTCRLIPKQISVCLPMPVFEVFTQAVMALSSCTLWIESHDNHLKLFWLPNEKYSIVKCVYQSHRTLSPCFLN